MQEIRTITFDPVPHTYVDETGAQYTSVTTLIGQVEPHYDAEFWAMYRAIDQMGIYKPRPYLEQRQIEITYQSKRRKFGVRTLYAGVIPLGKSAQAVTQDWKEMADEACEWGTAKHDYLETCINRFADTRKYAIHEVVSSNVTNTEKTTQDFAFKITNLEELANSPLAFTYPTIYEKLKGYVLAGWIIYAEKRVYSAKYLIAGTIDVLLVKGEYFIILDWKTNKKPLKWDSGYYKKVWNFDRSKKIETKEWVKTNATFKYPLNHITHCKGNIYTLQLSLYSYLCELWGLKHRGTVLCHIRPELTEEGEVAFEADGVTRIELSPDFYQIDYRKADVHRLLEWKIGNLKPYNPLLQSI